MKQDTLQQLISFRRQLHSYPQTGFKQFQTRARIKKILIKYGVQKQQMKQLDPTILTVDLKGLAPQQGQRRCIAFRADMDALTMQQTNQHLQYKSKNEGYAHMCGHDGHMACLVGFVPLYMQHRQKIPKNKVIRLLFQPSQQGPQSGAKLMVEKGCVQDVDEVYGFHQWPTAPIGQLWCKEGPVMSEITILKIFIIGTGGHGSQPQKLKQCTRGGVKFYQKALTYLDNLKKEKQGAFVCTLPVFKAGQRYNVISDTCIIEGTIRSFQQGLNLKIIEKFKQYFAQLQEQGFKTKLQFNVKPINSNTQKQAQHVLRVGKKIFGEDKVGKGKLPFKASEDFSYFTIAKPGAFFFLSTARQEDSNPPMIHNSNFDFNDQLIDKAAKFWLQLALNRIFDKEAK